MIEGALCPCGSGLTYSSCCQRILNDHRLATTAETLMRSRYSAFVVQNNQHILASWHKTTRPRTLNFEDNPVVWLGLEINSCQNGLASDNSGNVNFTCTYLEKGQLCKLQEASHFVKEDDLWFYVKGESKVLKEKIARNTPCPCGSGQKFKRCCLSK